MTLMQATSDLHILSDFLKGMEVQNSEVHPAGIYCFRWATALLCAMLEYNTEHSCSRG